MRFEAKKVLEEPSSLEENVLYFVKPEGQNYLTLVYASDSGERVRLDLEVGPLITTLDDDYRVSLMKPSGERGSVKLSLLSTFMNLGEGGAFLSGEVVTLDGSGLLARDEFEGLTLDEIKLCFVLEADSRNLLSLDATELQSDGVVNFNQPYSGKAFFRQLLNPATL